MVWHLIGKAQLSNDSAGQKFCLQDHAARSSDTEAWCGTNCGQIHHLVLLVPNINPLRNLAQKILVTKEARKFLESLLRRLNLAYAD